MSGDDRIKFCLLILLLSAGCVYAFFYAFRAWRGNRLVEDTPTSKVRSAAQGYVEFTGIGMMLPDAPTKAPLSGKPCTWWRYEVEERSSNSRSRSWSKVSSDTSAVPFLLDDGTGRCLIDPRGAEVYTSTKDVWYGDEEWPGGCPPDASGIGSRLVGGLFGGRYRYTEQRLLSREPLYAIGAYRSLGGVSVETPERAVAELLRDWKQDQRALLQRFDANQDGMLSASEWEQARTAAREQVAADLRSSPPTPGLNVMAKPADGRAFLLAAGDEESLARRLRYKAVAAIGLFVGTSALLTWMITHVW